MTAIFDEGRPILMAIVGLGGALSAARALEGGADLVQVRTKESTSRDLVELARAVVRNAGNAKRVIVNSRPDIAELVGAWGVHLPERGLDPRRVRRSFPQLVIGVSRHDRIGLERAVEEGADYAILGPVFDSPGKEGRALGIERLEQTLRGLPIPVIGVGGVTSETAAEVLRSGARGVAAIRPFREPQNCVAAARLFRAALDVEIVPPNCADQA